MVRNLIRRRMRASALFPVAVLLFACAAVCGCATVVSGTTQEVTVDSAPQGAAILVGGQTVGTTPGTVSVKRGKGTAIVVRKEGYQDQSVPLGTTMNPIFWGNIISGGTLGSITDFASGAYLEYSPNSYYVRLTPVTKSGDARLDGSEQELTDAEYRIIRYVLLNYTELLTETAGGGGEYVSGLAALAGYEPGDSKGAGLIALLKRLHRENLSPPRFAEAVARSL